MKGEERFLVNLLEGSKTRFVIPVYQRNYDWKREHCKRLFDDLEELISERRDSHFFGSIVSKAEQDARVLIDGQQRVTTMFLFFLALIHQVRAGVSASEEVERLTGYIEENYLTDKWHKDDTKLKLKLIKGDQEAFVRLFEENADLIEDSNVTQNYHYFCSRIKESPYNADQLNSAAEKLQVIDIKLERDDDPQLIFESLNSTGLDLSEGDKIRNYILMGLESDIQEDYYERYWNKIEKNTNYGVSWFVRFWLAAITRQTPSVNKVYAVFRDWTKKSGADIQTLLEEMLQYSEHWKTIYTANSGCEEIDAVLRRITLLDTSVVNPYLLNLLEYRQQKKVDDVQVEMALKSVETYIFRRWVCKVPTNALNKVFQTLHAEALRGSKEGDDYCEVLNYLLLHKESSSRMPLDDEFLQSVEERDFYHIQNNKFYLYDRLENKDSRERVNVVQALQDETFTVEHVMPQTLNQSWEEALGAEGADYEALHSTWVNRLANLTLTGYNSQYSNKKFSDKRDRKDGFKDSGLRINKWISEQASWGELELKQRSEMLKQDFLELWPLPQTSFVPAAVIHEEHSLSDDFDFSYRRIAAYSFMGTRVQVKNWVEMTCGVLMDINDLDPVVLQKYAAETEYPGRYFESTPKGEYWTKIADGVYFNPGSSTETKCDILRKVFERCGAAEEDLSFELYRASEEDAE